MHYVFWPWSRALPSAQLAGCGGCSHWVLNSVFRVGPGDTAKPPHSGKFPKFPGNPCDLLLPDFPWLFHLTLMAAGINIYSGCSERPNQVLEELVHQQWRGQQHPGTDGMCRLQGDCHTMKQRQIVGVCIQPWRDSAAVLIDMVHKMWRVFPTGREREFEATFKKQTHLWIPHQMLLSPCLSKQDN